MCFFLLGLKCGHKLETVSVYSVSYLVAFGRTVQTETLACEVEEGRVMKHYS